MLTAFENPVFYAGKSFRMKMEEEKKGHSMEKIEM